MTRGLPDELEVVNELADELDRTETTDVTVITDVTVVGTAVTGTVVSPQVEAAFCCQRIASFALIIRNIYLSYSYSCSCFYLSLSNKNMHSKY
jgi:hypothetical protein